MRDFSNKKLEEAPSGWFDRFMRKILFAKDIVFYTAKEEKIQARDVLKLFYGSLRSFPISIFIVLTATICASIIVIAVPLYYKDFFDVLSSDGDAASKAVLLRNAVLIILGLNLASFTTRRITSFGNNYLASGVTASLRTRAFAHLIDHSQRFFTGTFTGTLVQRVNRFAHAYDRLSDRFIYDIIPIVIQVIGVVWMLYLERPIIALIVLLWALTFVSANYTFGRWKLKYDIAGAAQDSKTAGVLADIITNQPTVDAHGSHAYEKSRYRKEVDTQMRLSRFRWNLAESMDGIQGFFVVLVEFAVFYVGVDLWVKGEFSIGLFVLVQAYIIRLSSQLWSFSRIIRDIYETFADAKEMAEIMLAPHEITEAIQTEQIKHVVGEIHFDHMGFGYHRDEMLHDISTTIKAGERVAIVGPSGAGKSTIVKLLFRFYDPTSGDISIDGVSIQKLPIPDLRQILALVPQDPLLFHRSIMENIRYGKPNATDEEVIQASRLAHCDEFVEGLASKYDTLVGERGIKLSGGERQRVALARAFLRNAPIIVLDEATSSLDSESERHIQSALSDLMKGRTTIVIAHRLSTIRSMDRIIVMDKGRIIEDGTHDELLQKKGMYEHLWSLQQGGFIAGNV